MEEWHRTPTIGDSEIKIAECNGIVEMLPQAKQNVVDDKHEVRCHQLMPSGFGALCACDTAMGDKIIRHFHSCQPTILQGANPIIDDENNCRWENPFKSRAKAWRPPVLPYMEIIWILHPSYINLNITVPLCSYFHLHHCGDRIIFPGGKIESKLLKPCQSHATPHVWNVKMWLGKIQTTCFM